MDRDLSEKVFFNQYLVEMIFMRLDTRSLFQMMCVSKYLMNEAKYQYEKRKKIVSIYMTHHERCSDLCLSDIKFVSSYLNELSSKSFFNIRPKHIFVMTGCYGRNRDPNGFLSKAYEDLKNNIPKDCCISFIGLRQGVDSGCLAIPFKEKSLIHSSFKPSNSTTFWCQLSYLMVPNIDGIEIKSYDKIKSIDGNGVKAVVVFASIEFLSSVSFSIESLIRKTNKKICFGGAVVSNPELIPDIYRNPNSNSNKLILTFGGHRVSSASTIIEKYSNRSVLSQLQAFKKNLGFNCDDWRNSWTLAFIFVDHFGHLAKSFESLFPYVGVYSFRTNEKVFGTTDPNSLDVSTRPQINCWKIMNPFESSVIVMVNIDSKYKS